MSHYHFLVFVTCSIIEVKETFINQNIFGTQDTNPWPPDFYLIVLPLLNNHNVRNSFSYPKKHVARFLLVYTIQLMTFKYALPSWCRTISDYWGFWGPSFPITLLLKQFPAKPCKNNLQSILFIFSHLSFTLSVHALGIIISSSWPSNISDWISDAYFYHLCHL